MEQGFVIGSGLFRVVAALVVMAAVACPLPGASRAGAAHAAPLPQPSTTVVISEFRTRGPAGIGDEFVELYNLTGNAIGIGGWRILGSDHRGNSFTCVTIPSGASIPAHGHFLAVGPQYSGSVSGDASYAATVRDNGGFGLLAANGSVVDQVGMHHRSGYVEGTPLAKLSTSADRSFERKVGGRFGSTQDTDDNANDFALRTRSDPQNLNSAPTPPRAGLVASLAGPSVVAAGQSITYNITVSNIGSLPANSTVITHVLPSGVSLVSYSPSDSSSQPSPGTLVWTMGDLPPVSTPRSITVVAAVPDSVAAGTVFTSTVAAVTPSVEDTTSDNSAAKRTWVGLAPDLQVTKLAPDTVYVGAPILFEINYANLGNIAATDVRITDHLPAGLSYASGSGGSQVGDGTVSWTMPNLPPGASGTVAVVATAAERGTVANRATIEGRPSDADPANGASTTETIVVGPDLTASTVSVSALTARLGDTLTYTITLDNIGETDATVVITDTLPGQVTLVDPGQLTNLGSGRLGWSGIVYAEIPVELPFTVRVPTTPNPALRSPLHNSVSVSDGVHAPLTVASPDTVVEAHFLYLSLVARHSSQP